MDIEKLVQDLGEHITRREFLKRLGTASLVALLGLIGLSETASATVNWHCCHLCFNPGSAQSWPYCNSNNRDKKTKWCWNCWENSIEYECCEYKNIGATCARDCDKVYASYGRRYGPSAPQP